MPSDLELMELQAEALFTHDQNGRIRYTNEPGATPAPRFFLGRTKHGNIWRFRYDLPDDVVRELDALAASEPVTADLRANPVHFEAFGNTLRAHAPIEQVYRGPAYRFPDTIARPTNTVLIAEENAELLRFGFPDALDDPERPWKLYQPYVAVVEHGAAVSVCFSARITPRVAEAGVETLEAFRGRGYATQAVAGWAVAVRELGRLPLYSTWWDNLASQGVARRLDLVLYGSELSFT